jgi:hypothetical protein
MSETNSFISKARWFEYGEKSNSFFLNLEKSRQQRKIIREIKDEEKSFIGHKQVSEGITNFYRSLYSMKPSTNNNEDKDFYQFVPKLSQSHKEVMDKSLTLNDLWVALSTTKDSAPGPDGIGYSFYKKYWHIVGPIIQKSWEYSELTGNMPPSHKESIISILPKEGKDLKDIKNWRPITLSNCDAKIITKALSNKISLVLDSIIDPAQTAYVPGRSVSDNLRANFFYKNFCKNNNINSILISLDAKKAFDSVSHDYIWETLIAYGFGTKFINVFNTLYNDLTA